MQLSHTSRTTSVVFDDPNLVSCAGLVPVLALARSAGLHELAEQHLGVPTYKGANAGLKVASLVILDDTHPPVGTSGATNGQQCSGVADFPCHREEPRRGLGLNTIAGDVAGKQFDQLRCEEDGSLAAALRRPGPRQERGVGL